MANIVITAVAGKNYHKIDYGSYATRKGIDTRYFWASDIKKIDTDGHVTVAISGIREEMNLSFDGSGKTLKVDSVLTVTPTSNIHLSDLIADLKG